MSAYKRWRTLGGGEFHRFQVNEPTEGAWQGTEPGTYKGKPIDIGLLDTPEGRKRFMMSVGLKDLLGVPHGTEIRLTYLGKKTAKNGSEFNAYQIELGEGAEEGEPPF